ncbi:MAG: hypothetical protein L6R37_000196 [Teloschistes peruensis]|nr:MAG: hypothetical protein L6R37_000196 [Teloschistes peruensis]
MLPYALPFFGYAFSLFLDPVKLLARTRQSIGPRTGYGIKVIGYNVYFIYRPANVAKLRKYPKVITTPGVITFVLKTLFGMVPTAVDMHTFDKSGIQANARPGSSVKSHNRIDHLTHANFHKHLLGEGLAKVYQGFAVSLLRRLPSLGIDNQWTQHSDLLDFWMLPMTSAMNEALAGPIIECVNPGFAKDLFQYYPYLHSFLKGWLKWLIPEAYRLQKSLIQGVATWHAIARARFHASDIDKTTGYDPCWGSAFMRERQQILRHVDNWDAHSIAASDFGIFWGDKEDIRINEWRIPKGSLVVVPAGDAHKDPQVWNTRNSQYPLDRFWAERILAYPGDPQSGLRKPSHLDSDMNKASGHTPQDDTPKFVMSGLADSYMPFGIGERTCPGRGFARREIILFCAYPVDRYDIELLSSHDQDYETTTAFYGIGTQRPKGKVPFRIRQRGNEPG